MSFYRLKRRHFLGAAGAAFGGRLLLDNIEAAAQGATSPARLLVVHWPGGTIRSSFLPATVGRDYMTTPILAPFEQAGLREQMIVLSGTRFEPSAGFGGGAERGTVMMMTGVECPAVRVGKGGDDPIAGGPSFDQIFLRRVPGLDRGRLLNFACDTRTDSGEISSRCLSYSYETQEVDVSAPEAGRATEPIPLLPETNPYSVYARLFEGFSPGATQTELAKRLVMKQSVLDSAKRELDRLNTLVPSSERPLLDAHAEAIRELEKSLSNAADVQAGTCAPELEIDSTLDGAQLTRLTSYLEPQAESADTGLVEQLAKSFFAILKVAFQCDLLRVATFQFCPSTNHLAFGGLYPTDFDGAYGHHTLGSSLSAEQTGDVAEFLVGAQIWFNTRLAEGLQTLQGAKDVFGGSVLGSTVVPFMTEKADMATDSWQALPSMLFGGGELGLAGGQYLDVSGRPHTDVWMSVAQALFAEAEPLQFFGDEAFAKYEVAPIQGLWSARD